MTQSNECPCGRARAGCEYHDLSLQPTTPCDVRVTCDLEATERAALDSVRARMRGILAARKTAGLKLLGPDDPEVSSDLIYLDQATGELVSVPQAPELAPAPRAICIGSLPLTREDFDAAEVRYEPDDARSEFRVTLQRGTEIEHKLHAMYNADRLAFRMPFVAIDARPQFQFATERAWFQDRARPAVQSVTYVLRFFR